jgi:hypothetical protein
MPHEPTNGTQGESWDARGRLGWEWSSAGYKEGTAEPPVLPVAVNLKDE